jgi:hypothetical protein
LEFPEELKDWAYKPNTPSSVKERVFILAHGLLRSEFIREMKVEFNLLGRWEFVR